MASIKDSIEEVSIEGFSAYIKFGGLGALLYYCIYLYLQNPNNLDGWFYLVSFVSYILLTGFLLKTTSNVKNGHDNILPSFNVFHLIGHGLKGLVALGPVVFVNLFLANKVGQFLVNLFEGYGMESVVGTYIILSITYILFFSFIFTAYLLYASKFNITDAYNLRLISKYSMDIILPILFFIPQIIFVDILFIGAITYLFWIFMGNPIENNWCVWFWCAAFIWNLAISGHYMAQLDYEIIDYSENSSDGVLNLAQTIYDQDKKDV